MQRITEERESSMTGLQIAIYASLGIFVVAVIVRVLRYRLTPIHMRWELYPVAHEKGRHHYGGSRFEELDWWTKKAEKDRFNELWEMMQEILLLKGVWKNNRSLWCFSFPFHVGLYLGALWLVVLVVGGTLELAGVQIQGTLASVQSSLLAVTAYAGFGLAGLGAVGLLLRRAGSAELRRFSGLSEFVNLILIAAVAFAVVGIQVTADPLFAHTQKFVTSIMAFRAPADLPVALQAQMWMGAFLLAYIPVTRMSHFVAKYFLYHDVRWHDTPNTRGSKIEARIQQALQFGVSWDAPHIPKGKKWGEAVTEVEK